MIPAFRDLLRPLLALVAERGEIHIREAIDTLADHFNLSAEERTQLLPSGYHGLFQDRVYWARTYLAKAGALDSPRRGFIRANARTTSLLADHPEAIDLRVLRQFDEFRSWATRRRAQGADTASPIEEGSGEQSPAERLELALADLESAVLAEIEDHLLGLSAAEFERVVVRLLIALGYGSRGSAEHLGRSGDGGVDGVIHEDRLGLEKIYLQAKRYTDLKVGRPEIQKFVGSLVGHRARKGVFITTSEFSDDAKRYADSIEHQVVLIGGRQLAALMFEAGLGVSVERAIQVKALDSDFFESLSG
jgi:restriction system protein